MSGNMKICILDKILFAYTNSLYHTLVTIQGEHKVFPWSPTFITRKLRGIQTYTHV